MTTIVDIWRDNPDFFSEKSCAQIIGVTGDGRLLDGNETSHQFRDYLSLISLDKLKAYAQECLSQRFDNAPYALQDIVNEIGSRLDFKIEPGRYRGVRNEVGFDGIWRSKDAHALLIEVKTTDTYRINLDTVANYRQALIQNDRITEDNSSILFAVG